MVVWSSAEQAGLKTGERWQLSERMPEPTEQPAHSALKHIDRSGRDTALAESGTRGDPTPPASFR